MRLLVQISLLISTSAMLVACSGGSSDPVKPKSPFAGIWMPKDVAEGLRNSKSSKEDCKLIPAAHANFVDNSGSIFDYSIDGLTETVQKLGSVDRDGKTKFDRQSLTAEEQKPPELQLVVQGDLLTVTAIDAERTRLHYLKVTKSEVARIGQLRATCKPEEIEPNLQ